MDYCAIQNLLRDSTSSRNVFHTLFYCRQIESYLEQHHVLEIIGELMVRVCLDRPDDVIEYLCEKLMEISRKYVRNIVKLEFRNSIDSGAKFIKTLSAQRGLPIIECVNNQPPDDFCKRLDKFLKRNLLHCHRLIICDFKATTEPEKKSLRIYRDDATPQECFTSPQDVVDIQLSDDILNQQQIDYIYGNIRSLKPRELIKGDWKHRVLIVGRTGAGKKTQGALIANEFTLKLIDLDYLIVQYQQKPSVSEKHNLGFWGFLQEALLKHDCLHGYVIVCNVISKANSKILMEKLIFQPNRIMFMHTSESECRRRLSTKGTHPISTQASDAKDDEDILDYQMKLYDLHKKEFVEHLASLGHKIVHINGNRSPHEIKTLMWANLARC